MFFFWTFWFLGWEGLEVRKKGEESERASKRVILMTIWDNGIKRKRET